MQVIIPLASYILATVAAAGIEWLRLKIQHGKVSNLNKRVSVAIGFGLWLLVVWMLGLWHVQVLLFGIACVGLRGVFYDPVLNLFRRKPIDHEAYTTNSLTDQLERDEDLSFWEQRIAYAIWTVLFSVLYWISL